MRGVTMVVATWNRAPQLHRSLQSLILFTRPDEVIVVDDGGSDNTEDVCYVFRIQAGLPVRYVYNDNPGWSNRCLASNVGIRESRYDEILFCDAETAFMTDVVPQLRSASRLHRHAVVCPEYCLRDTRPDCPLWQCERVPGGLVGLYRKEWLEEIGGWDEALPAPTGWDDADLHTRLAHAGHPQVKISNIIVRHQWHEQHPWNRGEDLPDVNPNLVVLQNKQFPRDLVANQGREWGVLRRR